MTNEPIQYRCTSCNAHYADYAGRCTNCGAVGTIVRISDGAKDIDPFVVCEYCKSSYDRKLLKCPSCGASSSAPEKKAVPLPVQPAEPARIPLAEALPTVRQVSSAVSSAAGCFTTIKMILLIMVVLVLLFFVAVCVLAFIRVASEDSATGASLRAAAALWGQISG